MGNASSRPRNHTSGESANATRSECSTPNVFDMASTNTKYSSVKTSDAIVTPRLPNSRSARIATRIADPFCTIITARYTELK